jgi:hypothetical protein
MEVETSILGRGWPLTTPRWGQGAQSGSRSRESRLPHAERTDLGMEGRGRRPTVTTSLWFEEQHGGPFLRPGVQKQEGLLKFRRCVLCEVPGRESGSTVQEAVGCVSLELLREHGDDY